MKIQKGVSLYTVISETILNEIKTGIYAVGDKLPTEPELSKQFDVSRTTIRMALQKLEMDGIINRMQGKGTFVKKPKHEENLSAAFKAFSDQMRELGLGYYSKVLELRAIPADSLLATKLEVLEKDPVIKLVRVRYANNEPLVFVTSYIPWKIAPDLINDDCSHSLLQLLKTKYQVKIKGALEILETVLIGKSETVHLGVPVGSPAFLLEAIVYSDKDAPIEYSHGIIRGDLMKFVTKRNYQEY